MPFRFMGFFLRKKKLKEVEALIFNVQGERV